MVLADLLDEMLQVEATEMHVVVNQPQTFRVDGALVKAAGALTLKEVNDTIVSALSDTQRAQLESRGHVDSLISRGDRRFILHVARESGQPTGMVLLLPVDVRPLDEVIGNEDDLARVLQVAQFRRGVVIVTGPVGSGKEALCAAMIETANRAQVKRIATIECPLEYDRTSKKSLITQHMVGFDFESYPEALKSVTSCHPDIAYISEFKDFDTFEAAFALAETGCLVITTFNQPTVSAAIKQLNDAFPSRRDRTRELLTTGLHAVVATQLVPKISGTDKVGAYEVLIATVRVRGIIQEGKWDFMNVMREDRNIGMQPMDDSLMRLYRSRIISYDEARHRMLAKDMLPAPAKHKE